MAREERHQDEIPKGGQSDSNWGAEREAGCALTTHKMRRKVECDFDVWESGGESQRCRDWSGKHQAGEVKREAGRQ